MMLQYLRRPKPSKTWFGYLQRRFLGMTGMTRTLIFHGFWVLLATHKNIEKDQTTTSPSVVALPNWALKSCKALGEKLQQLSLQTTRSSCCDKGHPSADGQHILCDREVAFEFCVVVKFAQGTKEAVLFFFWRGVSV